MKKIAFVGFLAFSCSQSEIPRMELVEFPFPDEIMGCSCALSSDRESFEAGQYLYVESFGKPEGNRAILFLNGERSEVRIDSVLTFLPEKQRESYFSSSSLKGKVSLKEVERRDMEVAVQEGKITLEKGKEVVEVTAYGICGC